jgi:predicted alpha/beta-hydrolase family hydrolase
MEEGATVLEEKLLKVSITSTEKKELGEVSVSLVVPRQYRRAAVVAHGAGGNMHTRLLVDVQQGLAELSIAAVRFNFLYSEKGKRAPDRRPQLLACWRSIADWVRNELEPEELYLAGKSMGGRMVSYMVAEGYPCQGVFFLGYPLHPPGKTDQLRKEHLPSISVPILFLSGTRDALCKLDLLKPVVEELGSRATLHIVEGGDHSFKVPKKMGRSEEEVTGEIVDSIIRWIESVG